jgi:DNA polymerase I-like protein with 3'-5' exonuclease and polymerase domains
VLRRELDEPLLGILEMDEFGKMSYFQFRSIVEDGVLALSQLSLSEDDAGKVVKAVNGVRKMAKAVNFLICYLGQPSTLAGNIGIPKAFAERIMAAVFASYARLAPWQAEMIALARKQGFVTTAYGNWKHVSPDILAKDGGKRSRAERQAVNQIVQGCAADILKIVLTQSERQGIFSNPHKAVMYAPVYDEVLSSVHMDYCFEYVEKMQDIMNLTPPGHAIPMMGEVSVGMNWCDQVELGDRPAERKLTELFDKWVKEAA